MLEAAKFKNFTCIPDADWEFASGINLIVGENGVGKSHVLKALYALLKVQADSRDLTKTTLEKAYAEKLVATLRPESLGRLTKRKQGRERCEIKLRMKLDGKQHESHIAFATNAKSQVTVELAPTRNLS